MTLEIAALVLTVVVHIIGAAVLVWAMLDGEQIDWRSVLAPGDDDGGQGRGPQPGDPAPPAPPAGDLPLPASAPSTVRLREPVRLGDAYPRPPRRPEHQPERPRVPEPTR